jgi:hypothetical protein
MDRKEEAMASRCVLNTSGAVALLLMASAAHAADKSQEVKFAPGTTSATIRSSLEGYDMNTYRLGASAGQTLSVTFTPSNSSCYYNVEAPGADEALFNGSESGDAYSGVLPYDGDYQVKVYLMRNAARRNETCKFSLTVEIAD